jgi:large subunit ribosomal protein L25
LETLEIQADPREKTHKRDAKRLLRSGNLPGILYGPKTAPLRVQFNKKEFSVRVAGLEGSHLVRLKSSAEGLAGKVALVKSMQYHPISGDVIHADLYEVDLTVKITVSVPLRFVGKAAGVVRGGILQPIVREIEVECLPLDIPESFNVDVSALDIGDAVHVEDLPIPEGVQALYETNFALVTVVTPSVEEAPVPAVAAETAAVPASAETPAKEGES